MKNPFDATVEIMAAAVSNGNSHLSHDGNSASDYIAAVYKKLKELQKKELDDAD